MDTKHKNNTTIILSHLLDKHKDDPETKDIILFYIRLKIDFQKTMSEEKDSQEKLNVLHQILFTNKFKNKNH